ncbi:MAG: signal peptidase II [Gammaproteobacteria bacterium]|nr:signal peptidase II [Gammaproteobacteria bacterium]
MKWLWLTALIIILDQLSKLYIMETVALGGAVVIFDGFNLVHACNPGAAFSFLSDAGGWQRWFFIGLTLAISVAIFIWLASLDAQQRVLSCALALILGGALGNLWDRVTVGCVVDFIQVYLGFIPMKLFNPWPAFNVADSAITIGAILLIIDTFLLDDAEVVKNSH